MAFDCLQASDASLSPHLAIRNGLRGCWVLIALLFLNCRSASAWEQMNMPGQAMETQDEMPPDQLPPPQRMTGIGNCHMQITATPEAQMWFDQGLNLLHDFWDYESARAFEQGLRVDTQCAMCYWGLYRAESFYHSTAQGYAGQALTKAVSLKRHASKHDRLYIEASAAQHNAAKNKMADSTSPEIVMRWRKLVRDYPKDTQAKIFLAQLVDHNECVAILRSILKDKPDDSAANHYYIHALESSEHPEQALHSADILGRLAPASGHMVHMPGHIFFRVGDYARAEQAFTASMHVDESYMKEQHVTPDNDWNYVHNLMYAIANLMEEGKLNEATALSAKLTTARGKFATTLYVYSTRDSITRLDSRLPVALRTGEWTQVIQLLKASPPPGGRPNLDFLARELTCFAEGMQAIEGHDLQNVEEWSTRFDAQLWRMSQELKIARPNNGKKTDQQAPGQPPKLEVMPDALLQPLLNSLSIMSLELRASLLAAHRDKAGAKRLFQSATQQEKALGYHEPPNYIRPVGETEGAAMMAIRDWTAAKSAYKQALVERPRSGFALYGIAVSGENSGDADGAAKAYADFLEAWKNADQASAELTHARAYLTGHPQPATKVGLQ